jgi:DHA3 family macrolide efflux protein-like MFS transporter
MAVTFALGYEYMWLLLICLVMRALGQGVQMPAVNALIPDIVPQEHLTRVNGISSSMQSVVMFVSPMAGAALLAVAPIHMLMFIDVVTAAFGISILFVFVKVPIREKNVNKKTGAVIFFMGFVFMFDKVLLKAGTTTMNMGKNKEG